uniref:NADH-ubiquinone oxidoreductase chain 2 n=1 Tax=Rhodosoma turcicum TaxID=1256665 RepID=S0DGV2_9ASCI|nr:NADH dehydrogenase subunit 2 [Rhodosoma turcicum]CCO25793.1 NADH dehydrogenase subunit 2 [Rhodosoma turcicum]
MLMMLVFLVIMYSFGLGVMVFSGDLFNLWLGMETMSLSVIFFCVMTKFSFLGEMSNKSLGLLKYFFIQVITGGFVLLFFVVGMGGWVLFVILFLKMGVFPGHSWVFDVYGVLSYIECFVLSVFPKFGPLLILYMNVNSEMAFVSFCGVSSVLFGGFLGLNYTDFRMIMGGSSVMNMGWLLISCGGGALVLFGSYLLYVLVLLTFFLFLNFWGVKLFMVGTSMSGKILMSFVLMGLLGMPLTLAFIMKLLIMMGSLLNYFYVLLFILILGAWGVGLYSRVVNFLVGYEGVVGGLGMGVCGFGGFKILLGSFFAIVLLVGVVWGIIFLY